MAVNWFRRKSAQKFHALPFGSSRALCGRWWLRRDLSHLRKQLPELGDICHTCADINDKLEKQN